MSELQRAFDAHLHIIDPSHPLIENNGYPARSVHSH
jgi:predicted TIM-barrel fold metal-dependent hydrolase